MNVLHYFLVGPTFSAPPIMVHSGVSEALDPEELAELFELWQNPTYPEDSYFTEDQFNAEARTKSMQRAQSPSILLCLLDTVDSKNHPDHIHTFTECMDYRSQQDIGPQDPWTYWSLYDKFPFGKAPVIIPPKGAPRGWTPIARVNPLGISEMNGWSGPGWAGYTFVTQIGGSKILLGYGPGSQIRVTLAAQAIFGSIYIGPATNKPFVASALYRLSFGGQNTNITVDGSYQDGGPGMYYTRTSDPLNQAIDAPNGLIISGYITGSPTGYAYLQTRGQEQDWYSRYAGGDHAAELDKSAFSTGSTPGWYAGGVSDMAVLMVEANF